MASFQKVLDELLRVDQPPQVKAGKILNLFMQYARENARLHADVETLRAHSHVVQATRLTRCQVANAFSQQDMQTGELLKARLLEVVQQFNDLRRVLEAGKGWYRRKGR